MTTKDLFVYGSGWLVATITLLGVFITGFFSYKNYLLQRNKETFKNMLSKAYIPLIEYFKRKRTYAHLMSIFYEVAFFKKELNEQNIKIEELFPDTQLFYLDYISLKNNYHISRKTYEAYSYFILEKELPEELKEYNEIITSLYCINEDKELWTSIEDIAEELIELENKLFEIEIDFFKKIVSDYEYLIKRYYEKNSSYIISDMKDTQWLIDYHNKISIQKHIN